MHDYKDFTVDQTDFGDLGTYLQSIKTSNHIKFIPIVDAGIAQRQESVDNYTTYTEGVKQDVFIKSGATNWYKYSVLQFTAQVWAGDAAFVDFTSLNA
jgi:alpha-glucosidase